MAEYLLDKLQEYSRSDNYPLHMPGHKRNLAFFENPYAIDITEIEGFDNLSHAEGILLEAQRRAAKLYGAEETFYLVNGSTCGILAAVSACVRRGDRILMARNSHKAAYHAALLNGLRVTYLYPETDMKLGMNGAIQPETLRKALQEEDSQRTDRSLAGAEPTPGGGLQGAERGDIRAVLITSPTYDGVVSDIRALVREAHRAGAILIVDEAHGAHFAMHPYFPESALACGADIVINSLHKTMPSLTQTALLHVQGPRLNRDRLRQYLGIYQSSSPSYVLMAAMDACIRTMQERGKPLFDAFSARLETLRGELGGLRNLYLVTGQEPGLGAFDFDRSRILISTVRCRLTGPELGALLRRRYHLEPEMEAERYVTAILTVADTEEGFARLRDALFEIDRMAGAGQGLEAGAAKTENFADSCGQAACPGIPQEDGSPGKKTMTAEPAPEDPAFWPPRPVGVLSMEEAGDAPHRTVPLLWAGGLISAEFAYLYPPGIPFIVPGERLPGQLPGLLAKYRNMGLSLQGLRDITGQTIEIADEPAQRAVCTANDRAGTEPS